MAPDIQLLNWFIELLINEVNLNPISLADYAEGARQQKIIAMQRHEDPDKELFKSMVA